MNKDIEKLKDLAYYDKLTRSYNRNAFEEVSKKIDAGFFIIFDIDFFKKINDTYGHNVGDIVLKEVAKILNNELLTFRWGGEEFVSLLPKNENVENYLNIIKEKISKIKIKDYPEIKITVSAGYTEYNKNKDINDIFKEADKALYCSKHEGRNRITKYEKGMDCNAHNDNGNDLIKNEECKEKVESSKIEICVDLDGTIIVDRFPNFGEPIEENVEILKKLKEKGFIITVFSARISGNPEWKTKIEKYLKEKNIPFDRITNIKPYTASIFIDDRNIEVDYNMPWPKDIEDKIEYIIKKHKIKANELEKELEETLEGLTSEEIALILDKVRNGDFYIPMLKLSFPEFRFNVDLLKKMQKREEKNF